MRHCSVFYSRTKDRCPEFIWEWRFKGTLMNSGSGNITSNQCRGVDTWRTFSER